MSVNTPVSVSTRLSEQTADNVSITGGRIDGAAINATTPAAITGTTITANTSVTTPTVTTASGSLLLTSAAGGVSIQGDPASSLLASSLRLGWTSGFSKLISIGADASTNGEFQLQSVRSDNSNQINVLLSDTSGNITVKGITATSVTTPAIIPTSTNLSLGAAAGAESLRVVTVASAVNTLQTAGSVTTSPVILSAIGTDSNIDIQITPKGSGVLYLGNAASFTANGSVATTMTSIGPTGSHTTIQEWLTVKNSSGTVRYIPAY